MKAYQLNPKERLQLPYKSYSADFFPLMPPELADLDPEEQRRVINQADRWERKHNIPRRRGWRYAFELEWYLRTAVG